MKKRRWSICFVILCLCMACIGCGKKKEEAEQEKIKVVTSNYPMYDFTKRIAGDSLEIVNLVPPGTEPHDWEPSVQDIAQLEEAKAFIYNGAGMEAWVEKVLESLNNKELLVVEASQRVDLLKAEEHDEDEEEAHHEKAHEHKHHEHEHEHHHEEHHHHHHGEWDPHVWLSLRAAQIEMENIKNLLVEVNPEQKEVYEENYRKAIKEFQALDEEFKETLAAFEGKEIVVVHEAFAYLCRDYHLHQLGIEGVFADSEPSPAKMKEIIDFVKEHQVKVIFFESLASPKVAEAIARETGAKTDMLNPIEGLTEEEMASGKDYLSVMRENLEALKKAFVK
ncbi:metal ABC transporter substrate-binding protein [uncultured Fusobacterium sp.]|uniref:metal ABC transporter substrate-binding protein n=1 Tax=uncultured Fusobacterium sp. TaxID=159267 RepID=UPI00259A7165|nr:metal ABC transporter substrate-binding protein [uncultured Fusobacterium sp.]